VYLAAHDSSAALIADGKMYAIELERLSRIKHSCDHDVLTREYLDNRIATKPEHVRETALQAIDYLLRAAGKTVADVDVTMTCNLAGARRLDDATARVVSPTHHEQHAASAYYPSSFDEAAVLVLDNFGERNPENPQLRETVSIWHGRGRSLRHVRTIYSPAYQFANTPDECTVHHSPGNFYTDCTVYSGFKVLDGGKTMGLSPYGTARLVEPVLAHVKFRDDGRIDFDRAYQQLIRDDLAARGDTFEARADVAYAAQIVLERCVDFYCKLAHKLVGSTNLCLAGGIALNSVANGKILGRTPFQQLFVQPAAKDSGLALGKALAAFYHFEENHGIELDYRGYYLGAPYGYDATIASVRSDPAFTTTTLEGDALYASVARLLADGKIVAWFQGGCEFGPRALGHRSILCNPMLADMKDVLNARVKHREAFRPFAPSVLAEHAKDYFAITVPSPYMLLVADVTSDAIPAVTHVDHSARLQTLDRATDERFYKLISAFRDITGVPVLLNTSFNVRGQPIVETPDEAVSTFRDTEIDVLVLGDHVIEKRRAQ
jgi:carbamoyltransferase